MEIGDGAFSRVYGAGAAAMTAIGVGAVAMRVADANHANGTLAGDGLGFAQIEQRGYVNVRVLTTTRSQEARAAIVGWQLKGQQTVRLDLFRETTDPAQAQVEVIDVGQASSFGTWYTQQCQIHFVNRPGS